MPLFLIGCSGEDVPESSNSSGFISISANVQEGLTPLTVFFTLNSSSSIEIAQVDFGDGTVVIPTSQLSVSHTFTEGGVYTVTATGIEDQQISGGGTFTDTVQITVLGNVNLIVSSFAIDNTINVTDPNNLESVSAIIQNIGGDPLTGEGIIEVGYFLSTDDEITVDDMLIGDTSIFVGDSFTQTPTSISIEGLGAGETYQYVHQLAVKRNIPTGSYYAGAIVDFVDYYDWYDFPRATDTLEYQFPQFTVFDESNENDNARVLDAYQITVSNTACVPDAFEDDDSSDSASTISVGESQMHNFCFDNSDWLKFDAVAGGVYKIATGALGSEADTQLILYDRDASSILLFDDNLGTIFIAGETIDSTTSEGDGEDIGVVIYADDAFSTFTADLQFGFPELPRSELVWQAEFTGTYFIKVRTTSCDGDLDTYCDGGRVNIVSDLNESFLTFGGSPDGVGLNTEYTISIQ